MHQAVQAWSFRQQIISRGVSKAEDNRVLPSAHGDLAQGVGKSSVCTQVMRKVEYQGSTRVVVKCNNDREYAIPQVISALANVFFQA